MRQRVGRRSAAAAVAAVAMCVTTLAAPAIATVHATRGESSTARTAQWTVTVWVAHRAVRAGTSIPATISIDNRSGHAVAVAGCPDVADLMDLGNAKIPNSLIVPVPACSPWKMSVGVHVKRIRVWTTYMACTNSRATTDVPRCSKEGAPALPPGVYRTNIELPRIAGLPTPRPLVVRLTN